MKNFFSVSFYADNPERWLSGRRRRSRKPLYPSGYRGFESPSLRHFFAQNGKKNMKPSGFASCTEGALHAATAVLHTATPCFILRLTMKHCSASLHNMKLLRYEALADASMMMTDPSTCLSLHFIFRRNASWHKVPLHTATPYFMHQWCASYADRRYFTL